MKKILMILLFFAALTAAASNEELGIAGAFGYNLGDDASGLKGEKTHPGIMEINAKIPFRNFNRCTLKYNDDKIIYYIIGEVNYKTPEEADREFKIVLNMLEKKYKTKLIDETTPKIKTLTPDRVFLGMERNGRRIILTKCTKTKFRLYYWDTKLNDAVIDKNRHIDQQSNNNSDAL